MKSRWTTKEDVLLASEPREVRLELLSRSKDASFFDPISAETEIEIIAMNNRLLDLTLAEHCLHYETAQKLFNREPSDQNVRLLVLSNTALRSAGLISTFPEELFGSEEALLDFLKKMTSDERSCLFSNPSLDESFLEAFLSLGAPWEAMDENQRLWALDNLAANEKLQHDRKMSSFEDGYDWYMAGRPIQAAWRLIEKLEPRQETANHLAALLCDLPADCQEINGIKKALPAWTSLTSDSENEEKENARARLTPSQSVRQAGARMLAGNHNEQWAEYAASDDIAIRCGAYEAAKKVDSALISEALERDRDLARVYLIRNPYLWRSNLLRSDLLYLVRRDADTEEPLWEFRSRDRMYRERFPDWFEDDEFVEPDERPITEGSISDIATAVSSSQEIKDLRSQLSSVEKTQQMLLWMLATLLISVFAIAWN